MIALPDSQRSAGFSLIEIVLAVGIIAFALVAILGLFPVAIQSATESQRETQAAFIAGSIYNDLRAVPGPETFVACKADYFGTDDSPPSGSKGSRINVNLSAAKAFYISYSEEGKPTGEIGSGTFNSGDPESAFVASVEVVPGRADDIPEGLSQVRVDVQAPGAGPKASRKSYQFVTVLNQNVPATP